MPAVAVQQQFYLAPCIKAEDCMGTRVPVVAGGSRVMLRVAETVGKSRMGESALEGPGPVEVGWAIGSVSESDWSSVILSVEPLVLVW